MDKHGQISAKSYRLVTLNNGGRERHTQPMFVSGYETNAMARKDTFSTFMFFSSVTGGVIAGILLEKPGRGGQHPEGTVGCKCLTS